MLEQMPTCLITLVGMLPRSSNRTSSFQVTCQYVNNGFENERLRWIDYPGSFTMSGKHYPVVQGGLAYMRLG